MTTIRNDTCSDLVPGVLTIDDLIEACTPSLLADRARLAATGDNRWAFAFGTLRPGIERVLTAPPRPGYDAAGDLLKGYAHARLIVMADDDFARLTHLVQHTNESPTEHKVVDLMAALEQSVARAKAKRRANANRTPAPTDAA